MLFNLEGIRSVNEGRGLGVEFDRVTANAVDVMGCGCCLVGSQSKYADQGKASVIDRLSEGFAGSMKRPSLISFVAAS